MRPAVAWSLRMPECDALRAGIVFPHHVRRIAMKRILSILVLALFTSSLVACNTMAGAGRDVQKVGEKVEEKAEECKDGKC
jgi:entericidin A